MRRLVFPLVASAILAAASPATAPASAEAGTTAAPNGVTIPAGYRDWKLITVAREEGKLDDVRAILGNDIAIETAREGKLPFPDGAIVARLAWSFDPVPESVQAFGQAQTHVAGHPKNGVQFMVKDSAKYAATGGWGFAQFDDGRPAGEAVQNSCFGCHAIARDRDFVFNRYAAIR